jgi:thioredoxin-related protein
VKDKVRLVLYSKPSCQLCDAMKDEIRKAKCADLYTLEEVNIESAAELLARYRYDIPVLLIEGVEAFRHRLTSKEFKAKLIENRH